MSVLKDYDFNILFLHYLISTGEALPHLPSLTARSWYVCMYVFSAETAQIKPRNTLKADKKVWLKNDIP